MVAQVKDFFSQDPLAWKAGLSLFPDWNTVGLEKD